jgi:hypothetical protein
MVGRGIRYFAGSMPLAKAVRGELQLHAWLRLLLETHTQAMSRMIRGWKRTFSETVRFASSLVDVIPHN